MCKQNEGDNCRKEEKKKGEDGNFRLLLLYIEKISNILLFFKAITSHRKNFYSPCERRQEKVWGKACEKQIQNGDTTAYT